MSTLITLFNRLFSGSTTCNSLESKESNLPVYSRRAIRNHEEMYKIQSCSALISKLPVEVRDMIWAHLFSGYSGTRLIHLSFEESDKLRGYLCGQQHTCECGSRLHGGKGFGIQTEWSDRTLSYSQAYKPWRLGWMGALTSCRALYFEATKILYSTSTFDISDCWARSGGLLSSIPLKHLAQISKVKIVLMDIALTRNKPNYPALKMLFQTLDKLPGLVDLQVEIASHETYKNCVLSNAGLESIEEQVLEQFGGLQGRIARKKNWVLMLPSAKKEPESEVEKELVERGWRVERIGGLGRKDGTVPSPTV